MLFDNFDKKIKEAAEQHHPAYDENAWRKMENLLDQHLPQATRQAKIFSFSIHYSFGRWRGILFTFNTAY